MIEEIATVTSTSKSTINVVTNQRSSCQQCVQTDSCSTSVLSKFFGNKSIELELESDIQLEAGDKVCLGIDEKIFLRLTGMVYLLPLLGLLLAAFLGQYLSAQMGIGSEMLIIVFGFLGFLLCFYSLKYVIAHYMDPRKIHPVILKKVG